LQRAQGRLPRALVAIMMGLGAGAASTAACSSVPRDEGAGGDGAGGEDGYGPSTSSSISSNGAAPSTTPSTTSYPSAVSTYGVGPNGCDMQRDCAACQTCAFDLDCICQHNDCEAEPECLALNDCANACAANDQACVDACVDANPNGVNPLLALIDCIYCDACYVTCDGANAEC